MSAAFRKLGEVVDGPSELKAMAAIGLIGVLIASALAVVVLTLVATAYYIHPLAAVALGIVATRYAYKWVTR